MIDHENSSEVYDFLKNLFETKITLHVNNKIFRFLYKNCPLVLFHYSGCPDPGYSLEWENNKSTDQWVNYEEFEATLRRHKKLIDLLDFV